MRKPSNEIRMRVNEGACARVRTPVPSQMPVTSALSSPRACRLVKGDGGVIFGYDAIAASRQRHVARVAFG